MSYEDVFQETLKVYEHLTDSNSKNSIELSLLSGHLLIESAINILLEKKLFKPSLLKLDRMMFAQKMNLLRAIIGDEEFTWQWDAMKRMNKLRNTFAHDLEKPTFQNDIDSFVDLVRNKHSNEHLRKNFSKEEKFVWAITSIHTYFMRALQNEN